MTNHETDATREARPPDWDHLVPTKETVVERLRALEVRYRTSDDVDERRSIVADVLETLREYLGEFVFLDEIGDALFEASRGNDHPLFRAMRLSHRPPKRFAEAECQAQAALTVEALMLAGRSKRRAVEEVAKRLGAPWKTVANIRDGLNRKVSGGRYRDLLDCPVSDGNSAFLVSYATRLDQLREAKKRGEDMSARAAVLLRQLRPPRR